MANTTTAANTILSVVDDEYVLLTFLNQEFFEMFPKEKSMGSSAYRWDAISTDNASGGTASDGAPFTASASLTWQQASLSYQLWDSAYEISDGLNAALAVPGADILGSIRVEAERALARLYDNIAATMLGSTGMGWELAADSTGTYAGIDRSTVTNWASRETAVSGVLTAAVFYNDEEALLLPERAGSPDTIFVPIQQYTNYMQLSGAGASTSLVRVQANSNQAVNVNAGGDRNEAYFGNMRLVPVRDMTSTITIMTERALWKIIYHNRNLPGARDGGLVVEPVARGGYVSKVNMSWFGVLAHLNPHKSAKNTAVTA